MSSLHQFFVQVGQRDKVLASLQTSTTKTLEVSEIWQSEADPKKLRTVHRTVSQPAISKWLLETRNDGASSRDDKCLLRIVWVTKYKVHDVAPAAIAEVAKAFELELAQEYAALCNRGVGSLPETTCGTRSYFFCNGRKIALSWSRERGSMTKNAICIAEGLKIQTMRESLDYGFVQDQASDEMVVGLLSAVLLSREIDTTLKALKQKIREVEIRTGYHEWQTRSANPALGDLESLSAKMIGCETRNATMIRKMEVLRQLIAFISQQLVETRDSGCHDGSVQRQLELNLEILVRTTNIHHLDANVCAVRTKAQLTALFHIIAQNDVVLSHEISKDSRLLALAAQRDSSSMKCLAVVAMFFLPGTFVSSLFAMPLFDWQEPNLEIWQSRAIWGPRLMTFATVTIPLMLLTFAVWGFWIFKQGMQRRRQRKEADVHLRGTLKHTELMRLGELRMSSSSSSILLDS
ncbi:uncharacterized protein A1O9_07851 [Exophiala aquamarina CBS 119918]|uniref:Uncharacterized protein n=1 Tax=Exophiala aquamarina CBS 119918 TaxID=1182545 RepID=A0A072PLB5_9EURO|nr:uncharacterized protein A1O9_07851 [Exophiala aquamarina CBS 119918]KEF56270.1 hypothetical protein A1O9_07851 [Exophiala aquamarina CBS 119918]